MLVWKPFFAFSRLLVEGGAVPAPTLRRDRFRAVLVLASASPRRIELLRQAGFDPIVDPANIDETPDPHLTAEADAARLARGKAELVSLRHPAATVIGADTIVVEGGELFGKPRDADDARRMLSRLAGHGHFVVTAVQFIPPEGLYWPPTALRVSTAVMFRALQAGEIERYIASCEWADKAGGYAIQGLAASFVQAIAGSYTNVVGLPLAEVVEELRRFGELGGTPR